MLTRQDLLPELERLLAAGANSHDVLVVAAHFRRLELERWLVNRLDGQIASGPFQGLQYPKQAHASTLAPKLLGTYEKEIQADLLTLAAASRTFLDIGCAEGYYTTGLAARAGLQQVVGVDSNQEALQAAAAAARANGVDHRCRFFPDLQQALAWLSQIDLLLIDVDGAELAVLDSLFRHSPAGALTGTTLVIETDFHADGRSNRTEIIARLANEGFEIQAERMQSIHNRFCELSQLGFNPSFFDRCLLGLEGRPSDQSWLIARKDGLQGATDG